MTTQSLLDRLLPKTAVDPITGCWNWTGAKYDTGYGQFYIRGKHYRAHRVSYELHRGEIPINDGKKMMVLHRCDNPACVNPDHLFLGTAADNSADMISKDRQDRTGRPGESNPRSKISSAAVAEIRAATGVKQKELALKFGISRSQVSYIQSGKSWRTR